jgi:hypothetical protein
MLLSLNPPAPEFPRERRNTAHTATMAAIKKSFCPADSPSADVRVGAFVFSSLAAGGLATSTESLVDGLLDAVTSRFSSALMGSATPYVS